MAMPNGSDGYLYRLLRDDEDPLNFGIMAKNPLAVSEPVYHIRYGSCPNVKTQWISTCASKETLNKYIELKKNKFPNELGFKYVQIDLTELQIYADKCTLSIVNNDELAEVIYGIFVRNVPFIEKTGRILPFTDETVVNDHLFVEGYGVVARNYASCYQEVLVERFIPPHCCKKVVQTDGLQFVEYNQIPTEKIYKLTSMYNALPLPPGSVRYDLTTNSAMVQTLPQPTNNATYSPQTLMYPTPVNNTIVFS